MENGRGRMENEHRLLHLPSSILPPRFPPPMTRRIALAILLTVWAILIAGCVTAYFSMRAVLIEQLDESIVAKARALPELRPAGTGDNREPEHPASAVAPPADKSRHAAIPAP